MDECKYCGHRLNAIECVKLQAETEKLKEFARYIIRTELWSIHEQDGCETEDLAKRLGLIEPHIATVDDDYDDYNEGDTIYKFSDTLKEKE